MVIPNSEKTLKQTPSPNNVWDTLNVDYLRTLPNRKCELVMTIQKYELRIPPLLPTDLNIQLCIFLTRFPKEKCE